jgi:hypothetical protein
VFHQYLRAEADQLLRNAAGQVLKHELRTKYGRGAQKGGSSV